MMMIKEAVLLSKDQKDAVALKSTYIDVKVQDIAALTTITQTFENTEDRAIEAVYCFPVEEGAAVCALEIETGGRTINGKTEEKEKAFEIYDKEIEKGNASFLLDQEKEDILSVSIGNVKPNQSVVVKIRYVSELPVVDDTIRLQIPTTVSPRYAPPESNPVEADRITPPYQADVPYIFDLRVLVLDRMVVGMESPSHKITREKDGDFIMIGLAKPNPRMDRDFILEMKIEKPEDPRCLTAKHKNGTVAALFRLYPDLTDIAGNSTVKSEAIFVLDCSGSMSGSSISEAKQALELALRSLSEGDRFNIFLFGSEFAVYSEESEIYSDSSLKKAIRYIHGIDADMGGTELMAPISHICAMAAQEGFQRDVLLFTDGEVTNPDEVIQIAASSRDKMRVFTFGIGYGASHHLVKGIARATNGTCEMIQPGEKIQPKVLRQFSRMSQPFLTNLSLDLEGGDFELPGSMPPIFDGDSCTVYLKITSIEPGSQIKLTGTYLEKSYTWTAKALNAGMDDSIPSLWALSKIELLKEEGPRGSGQIDRKREKAEREITRLGLDFNLLTDYTSFVAVEKRSQEEKSLDAPAFRRIPVLLTKDWHGMDYYLHGAAAAGMPAESALLSEPTVMAPVTSYKSGGVIRGIADGLGSGLSSLFNGPLTGKKTGNAASGLTETVSGNDVSQDTWYLDLLATQLAGGSFEGMNIVTAQLGISIADVNLLAGKIKSSSKALAEKLLITWLAIRLLKRDPDTAAISGRAIRKAEKWLKSKTFDENVAIFDGVTLTEYIKKELGVEV